MTAWQPGDMARQLKLQQLALQLGGWQPGARLQCIQAGDLKTQR